MAAQDIVVQHIQEAVEKEEAHLPAPSPLNNMPPDLLAHINDFLDYLSVERNCSKLTIRDYRHYLEVFGEWFGTTQSHRTIQDLDIPTVRRFRVFLASKMDAHGMTLMRVTQNYYIIALRSFLKFLIKNDIKTLEPTKIDLPKTESRSLKFLDREHIDRMVTSIDTSKIEGIRDRTILELLFSTGLRVSELCKLNHQQVNIERREFGVIGKGGRARVVFISDRAAEWVEKYMAAREDTYKPLFIRYSGKEIPENGGEKMRLTPRSVERMVKKYVRIARIPVDATVHTLRHSFATDLLSNGADLRSVQEMLGHKNIATTQIYTHITNRQLRDVHAKFHSGNKEK